MRTRGETRASHRRVCIPSLGSMLIAFVIQIPCFHQLLLDSGASPLPLCYLTSYCLYHCSLYYYIKFHAFINCFLTQVRFLSTPVDSSLDSGPLSL